MPPVPAAARTFTAIAAEQIDDQGRQWIEVMPTGEKLRNGQFFFTITRADLETFAESIRAQGDKIPVDYDHEGDRPDGSTRASGWFTGQAEVRGTDGDPRLWAEVQWTPAALEAIENREFRFISPVFSFAKRDRKSGLMTKAKELVAATLTNRPFFKQLAAVAAEVAWQADEGFERIRQRVHQALNPGGSDPRYWVMDIAPGKALVDEYQSHKTWVAPFTASGNELDLAPASEWQEAEKQWVEVAAVAAKAHAATRPFNRKPSHEGDDMPHEDIIKALGLAEDADDEAVLAAVNAAKENADKVSALEEKVQTLEAAAAPGDEENDRVQKLEEDLATERKLRLAGERASILAAAVTEGRIVPATSEKLDEQYAEAGDLAPLKAILASFPARAFKTLGSGDSKTEDEPDIDKARGQFTYSSSAGTFEADDESLKLHAAAEKILAEQGKQPGFYTESEYREAALRANAEAKAAAA